MPSDGYESVTLPEDLVERIDQERAAQGVDSGTIPSRREHIENALNALQEVA